MTQAVDIRAQTFCSLGRLIRGDLADTYAQGSGLITTRGSVELDGLYRPSVGTRVEFAYAKNGYIARLPRTVRVLSSFADPLRNKTTVQLGCLLTFLENRKPPVPNPNSKEENDVPCYVYDKATLPISAKYVVKQILSTLGITSATIPLTNVFSVEEFDLTPGFIQVLGDLLVSEGYIGYLDEAEVLQFRDLGEEVESGPVVDSSMIIDLGPIGVGDLPGDAVIVNYSSRRLMAPDSNEDEETRAKRSWEWEEVFGAGKEVSATYTDGNGNNVTVTGVYNPYSFIGTKYDDWDRAVERYSYEEISAAEANSRFVADRLSIGNNVLTNINKRVSRTVWTYKIQAGNSSSPFVTTNDITTIKANFISSASSATGPASACISSEKPEGYADVLEEITRNYISDLELAATLNLDSYKYVDADGVTYIAGFGGSPSVLESVTKVSYEKDESSGITKTRTTSSIVYGKTTGGQQDMATLTGNPPPLESFGIFVSWLNFLLARSGSLKSQGTELRIRTEREFGLQRRPSQQERNNSYNQKPEVTEQKAEVTWITGGTESTNYIEFNLPYAPDDKISWTLSGGYTSQPSDAGAKALKFGRIQNRLLLGNRNGLSMQVAPEVLPPRPFDPIYISVAGLVGQYRLNGCTWSFDSSGIVASGDFLYWGAVGTTA